MTYHLTSNDLENPNIDNMVVQLKQLLVSKINPNLTVEQIDNNASILEDELGLDSIMVVEFIVLLEKMFGFKFSEDDLSMEAFSSLETLAAFILHKTEQSA